MNSAKTKKRPCRVLSRFERISDLLKTCAVDAFLLSSEPNVSYASGFFAPESYALVTCDGITVITDFRYTADFQKKARLPVKIQEIKSTFFKTIAILVNQKRLKTIGFESRHLTFAECEIFQKNLPKNICFIPLKETLEPLRQIKEPGELETIRKATKITLETFDFIRDVCKPGVTELEVAAEIERMIRLKGAQASAFDIMVASGPNSSYPHAAVSRRVICKDEPVVIDMGVELNGYKSDLTRTLFLGKINGIVKEAYEVVRIAQQRAIKAIKPGIIVRDIDQVARNYIEQKGFGKFFGHALGHGIGLEVHESPSINKKNTQTLEAGTLFTVEPGIYKAGEFGIRIEDIVLVTPKGAEVLSGNTRN